MAALGSDRYDVVQTLGSGTSGVISLVRHRVSGELFVEKVINTSKFREREYLNAMTEVKVMSELKHPYMVCHHESFYEGDSIHIVMEYCDGGDLHNYTNEIRDAGRLIPEERCVRWFAQICQAVQQLHSRNIMHRDLKLQNIFLCKADDSVRLGDFGLTVALADDTAQAVTMLGTPYYMSPELCLAQPYNFRSDMWALGCILYKLCALRHAFPGSNFRELSHAVLNNPPEKLNVGKAKYSKAVRHLINSLLQKDPAKRPTIDEVLRADILRPYIGSPRDERTFPLGDDEALTDSDESADELESTDELAQMSTVPIVNAGKLMRGKSDSQVLQTANERAYESLKEKLATVSRRDPGQKRTPRRSLDSPDWASQPSSPSSTPETSESPLPRRRRRQSAGPSIGSTLMMPFLRAASSVAAPGPVRKISGERSEVPFLPRIGADRSSLSVGGDRVSLSTRTTPERDPSRPPLPSPERPPTFSAEKPPRAASSQPKTSSVGLRFDINNRSPESSAAAQHERHSRGLAELREMYVRKKMETRPL